MAWETPKTDWYGDYVPLTNAYTGDYFNAEDYNRLKNNTTVLYELASELYYPSFEIDDMGDDKTYKDFLYADEMNTIAKNLIKINTNSVNVSYSSYYIKTSYAVNGYTMTYQNLNAMEKLQLQMYELMSNQYKGRRMFKWNFGFKEGF